MAVDADVSDFPVLEVGFMIVRMVVGEGHIIVTTSPPDFGVSDCNLFFLGQGR